MSAFNFCRSISVACLVCLASWAWAYEAFQGPTELIQYDPARAYEGYTLFTPGLGRNTYLIDMDGQVVNFWPLPESLRDPGFTEHARLLPDGRLLRGISSRNGSIKGLYQTAETDSP